MKGGIDMSRSDIWEEQEELRSEIISVMEKANESGWTFELLKQTRALECRIDLFEAKIEKY